MEQRKSQKEILKQLVSDGHLTSDQADDVAQAPVLAVTARELVSYLAAILITIGVGFIVAGLVANVPQAGIAVLLYVVAAVLAYFSHKLSSAASEKQRVGEVMEIASVLAIAVASGILLDMTNMRSEWYVCILAVATGTWGVLRASRSQFSGSILMAASVPIAIMSSTSMMSLNGDNNRLVVGLMLLAGGAGLIYMGMKNIGFAFLPRAFGSLLIVIGSITLAGVLSTGFGSLIPIGVGVALFTLGSRERAPENLLAGAFGIIVGVIMNVVYWLPGNILQGLSIIGCGVVLLLVLRKQLARASQLKPGAPTA
ncbi:MAG: hypothetical protein CK521_02420 [Acidimicrobium sp.]|nr:DUF2157 domain-containing protein [Ilumatobacteraceae bacterium]PHX72292.1 MAG: hypothetical protein CK521_02420 [Acidimicrobium sp.]